MPGSSRSPRLWPAAALSIVGIAFGVLALVRAVRRDDDWSEIVVAACYILLTAALGLLLLDEQRRRQGSAARIRTLEQALASQTQALSEAGSRDSLTGLPNRLAFYEMLEGDFQQAMVSQQPLSCMLIDLDHLRRINDRFGHHFGDRVLERFTRLLVRVLRAEDSVCRFGGDQFMVLLHSTAAPQALSAAERVRGQLKREVFSDGHSAAAITASFGIATVPLPGITTPNELIERVEAAMTDAKSGGRDRVAVDPEALMPPRPDAPPPDPTQRPARRASDQQDDHDA